MPGATDLGTILGARWVPIFTSNGFSRFESELVSDKEKGDAGVPFCYSDFRFDYLPVSPEETLSRSGDQFDRHRVFLANGANFFLVRGHHNQIP